MLVAIEWLRLGRRRREESNEAVVTAYRLLEMTLYSNIVELWHEWLETVRTSSDDEGQREPPDVLHRFARVLCATQVLRDVIATELVDVAYGLVCQL